MALYKYFIDIDIDIDIDLPRHILPSQALSLFQDPLQTTFNQPVLTVQKVWGLSCVGGKLASLEEFRVQREELMTATAKLEATFQEKERIHQQQTYDLEKKQIIDTDRYSVISYHIIELKRQNRLKVGTNKPKLKVKMQSVSNDDVRKRRLEKPRFELAAKGVFRL